MMVLVVKAMRIAGKDLSSVKTVDLTAFKDYSSISSYAKEAVTSLVRDGLVVGSGDTLNPIDNATRAEAAVLLYNIYNR